MKGFTLIELLVVVLIIGILSAVALPQYKKAVNKSKFNSMLPMLADIKRAEELYYMANGTYAKTWEELGYDVPSDFTFLNSSIIINYKKNQRFTLYEHYVGCGLYNPNTLFIWWYDHKGGSDAGHLHCYHYDTKESEELCRSVSSGKSPSGHYLVR